MATLISDWNDLDAIRNDLGEDYTLANDLDSSTPGYSGIGDDFDTIGGYGSLEQSYTKIFNGDGYEIRDLTVADGVSDVALFNSLADFGVIRNLGVVGSWGYDVNRESAICAITNGSTIIENCYTDVTLDSNGGQSPAGIVGAILDGDVRECAVFGSMSGGEVAGITTFVNGSSVDIEDCYVLSPITGMEDESGGAFGVISDGDDIDRGYVAGVMEKAGPNEEVGAIAGDSDFNVDDWYWDVERTPLDEIELSDGASDNAFLVELDGGGAAGDFLTTDQMTGASAQSSMSEFDFSNTWETVEAADADRQSDGYPILRSISRSRQLELQSALYPDVPPAITLSIEPGRDADQSSITNGRAREITADSSDADRASDAPITIIITLAPEAGLDADAASFTFLINQLVGSARAFDADASTISVSRARALSQVAIDGTRAIVPLKVLFPVDLQTVARDSDISTINFGILFDWNADGVVIGSTLTETRTWDEMVLTVRYSEDVSGNIISEITRDVEKVEALPISSGGFRAVDQSGGGNVISLSPANARLLVRSVDEWLVKDFTRASVNRDGDVFDIELVLVPRESKSFDGPHGTIDTTSPPNPTRQPDQFKFDFAIGSIATSRVLIESSQNPDGTTDLINLQLVLTEEEVRVFEENASHLNTVRVRVVPDGSDVLEDASVDGRNTITVTPPDNTSGPIKPGEYVFREWETEWIRTAYRCSWTLGRAD
jgi:hypothetical protein